MFTNNSNVSKGIDPVAFLFDRRRSSHIKYRKKAEEMLRLFADLEKMTGEAFAGQDWLADRLNICIRYVQKIIAELRNAGLILVIRREQNFYKVLHFFGKTPRTYKSPPASDQPKASSQRTAPKPTQGVSPGVRVGENIPESEIPAEIKKAKVEEAQEEKRVAEARAAREEEEARAISPEVKEAIELAAKQVKKANIGKRPTSNEYCERVSRRLAEWGISAPRLAVAAIVLQYWQSWF